jgi:hypothetical protein
MRINQTMGDGPYGLPFMKFTLTYEGYLPSNGSTHDKWRIRNEFHPQLVELWEIHRGLKDMHHRRYIHESGAWLIDHHHSKGEAPQPVPPPDKAHEYVDVLAPVTVGGRQFMPLVRNTLALNCGLKIQFLRKEEPGRVIQQGDLDNRLKTLFDALSMPDAQQIVPDTATADPIHCLLENDGLIAGVAIETHRLLNRPNTTHREVHLLIEVDVRVTQSRFYNQPFLGD